MYMCMGIRCAHIQPTKCMYLPSFIVIAVFQLSQVMLFKWIITWKVKLIPWKRRESNVKNDAKNSIHKTVILSQSFRSWAAAASPALPRAVLRSSRVAELVLCSHWASMALSQLTGAPCMRFGLASMFDSSPGRNPRWVPISLHLVAYCESWPTRPPRWYWVSLPDSHSDCWW